MGKYKVNVDSGIETPTGLAQVDTEIELDDEAAKPLIANGRLLPVDAPARAPRAAVKSKDDE